MSEYSKEKLRNSIIRLYKEHPEILKKISDSVKKRWQDPAYREKCELAQKGSKALLWKGGISLEPYSFDFNRELKELIRKRDSYTCQECGKSQGKTAFPVHHIDYDKKNSNPLNLITLCTICHGKTNQNRESWQEKFTVATTK